MPNIWTTYTQKIYEAFNGPRTKDTEFDIKVEELKACERSLSCVKTIFLNFFNNTRGLKQLYKEVYMNLIICYPENSPYYPTICEICKVHQEAEALYDSMADQINIIGQKTSEWNANFEDIKKHIAIRAEYRRTYDHYDEKMEKLVKSRNEKLQRGQQENVKDMEAFERNDLKYKKSMDDYVKQSMFTYNLMTELLEFRYKLLNPAVMTFVNEEKKFYFAVANLFRKFEDLQMRFINLDKQTKKEGNSYDPRKYVRGYQLLNGVNISELPKVKLNEETNRKYSYEDYMKNKTMPPTGMSNFDPNANMNQNKYSYEQYLQNRNSVSNKVNTNTGSNVYSPEFKTFNENYKDVSLNFDLNQNNKGYDMRATTILPEKSYIENQNQEGDYNPYSVLSFDNNMQDFRNTYGMGNQGQMNNNINRPRNNSQMNQNQQGMNNFNYPNQMNPNLNNNNRFPNINEHPSNMKFPR